MAISWDSFDKIWASTSPLTPYSFSDQNYAQGWNFVGSTPPARQMWDSIQKKNDEKFKYLRDNFGTPNIVTSSSQMTDTEKVYVYMGSEAGWNNGHWYYYNEGTSSWEDGGVYNSVAFVTDTTLSIAGQPADAKATGDALALKSDLAGCTFTGNVSVNADLSVTGDATIGTDLSVTGVSTLTGNVSAGADVTVVGDVSSANMTTSADATIGGNLSVTGASTLAGNITTSGDISADNISATTNGTVGGNLSVTGISTLTGNINAGADINAVGDVSADNLTTTTNATVGGSLSVAGTSTLTGNVTTNGNINAVGDISSANLITTNATIGGNATVTGDVSCANLTTSADASVGGDLTVTGDSTLADTTVNDLDVNNDLSVAGDSSLTNLSVSGTTALAGTSTAPTPSADDNSTKIATTEYVQTELKPIETKATIDDKRISNIEKLLQGNLYDYQTDSTSAYTKSVPQGAMPYASLDSIGGKTLVWNQLVQNGDFADTSGWTKQNGNISASDNELTYTITSIGSYYYNNQVNRYGFNVPNGHVIFLHVETYAPYSNGFSMSVRTNNLGQSGVGISNVTPTPNTWNAFSKVARTTNTVTDIAFYWSMNTDYAVGDSVKLRNCFIIDLTLMFGAGNEPSTVAEFEAMFPADYYPYNAGTLLSAGVTEVVSKGKNLLDTQRTVEVSLGYTSNTTKRNLAENQVWKGMGYSGYTNSSISNYSLNNGSITYKSSANGYGIAFPIKVKPNTTYRFHCIKGTSSGMFYLQYNAEGYLASSSYDNFSSDTIGINTTASTVWLMVGFAALSGSVNTDITINDIMVEESSTDSAYTPYRENTYPIPAEIQALEGYGWSAGTAYNYIDYERKVFVKNVGRLNLGSTETTWYYNTAQNFFSCVINGMNSTTTTNAIVQGYTLKSASTGWANMVDYEFGISAGSLRLHNSAYTASEAFKQTLVGKYAYYELATPQETDISAYLTDDNLIEVEAGGSLTFPNQHGDDYRIDVPSAETYMIDLQASLGE